MKINIYSAKTVSNDRSSLFSLCAHFLPYYCQGWGLGERWMGRFLAISLPRGMSCSSGESLVPPSSAPWPRGPLPASSVLGSQSYWTGQRKCRTIPMPGSLLTLPPKQQPPLSNPVLWSVWNVSGLSSATVNWKKHILAHLYGYIWSELLVDSIQLGHVFYWLHQALCFNRFI